MGLFIVKCPNIYLKALIKYIFLICIVIPKKEKFPLMGLKMKMFLILCKGYQ